MKSANQEELPLARRKPQELAQQQPEPTAASMIQTIVSTIAAGKMTPEGAQASAIVMEKLVQLQNKQEDRRSEREFAIAFNALQSDMPIITATSVIPNRGKYEKFEDIMRVIKPLLIKHGFTVSFSMDFKESRILETCHLTHIGGHTRSNSFAVRSGRADSETQSDCKAATTAKRNALCNALNISIQQDCLNAESDGRIEGGHITSDQAEHIRQRVDELKKRGNQPDGKPYIDEKLFWQFAKATKFEDIPESKYSDICEMLTKKERLR